MRTMVIAVIVAAGVAGATFTCSPRRQGEGAHYGSGEAQAVTPDAGDRLARIRDAGLSGDAAQIPGLLDALAKPKHPLDRRTVIHALALLHATDALPDLDSIIGSEGPGSDRDCARIARARITAETGVAGDSDPTRRAEATARTFLDELSLDVQGLNAALPEAAHSSRQLHGEFSIALYALRELADMVYRTRDGALSDHLQNLGVNFGVDDPSALKMRLALLPQDERIATLVDELAVKRILRGDDFYAVQLAIDEGKPATDAVVAKLAAIEADRKRYTHTGIAALFDVLRGSGDKSLEPVLAKYLEDPDTWVAHYAKIAYRNVKDGLKFQYCAGY